MEKTTTENKLFGISRPLAGALIGFGGYLLVLLPLKYLDYNSTALYFLSLGLETLGRIATLILGLAVKINMSKTASDVLSMTISALPAGFAGMQIASLHKATRRAGMVSVILYALFILVLGTLMILAGI
jgi:hypothetical protein